MLTSATDAGVSSDQNAARFRDVAGGWRSVQLGELGTLLRGRGIKREDVSEEGPGCVRYGEIYTSYTNYFQTPQSRISRSGAKSALAVESGDLLFAATGETVEEIGKCVAYLGTERIYAGGDIIVLRAPGHDPLFLAHLLASHDLVRQKARSGQGDIVVHLHARQLATLDLVIPKHAEQRAIANALRQLHGWVDALDELTSKKRVMKQGVMHALLSGNVRLPGFSTPWRRVALGELGHWRGGMTPSMSNPRYWSGGAIPWISSSDISLGRIGAPSRYLTEEAVRDTSLPVMPAGTVVVVTRSGVLRRTLPVARLITDTAINQDIRAVSPGPLHDPLFLEQTLIQHEANILSACMKPGTTVESIDRGWFDAFEIPMPNLPEQNAIAAVLEGLDGELVTLTQQYKKAVLVRTGIAQALLSGRTQLTEPREGP